MKAFHVWEVIFGNPFFGIIHLEVNTELTFSNIEKTNMKKPWQNIVCLCNVIRVKLIEKSRL